MNEKRHITYEEFKPPPPFPDKWDWIVLVIICCVFCYLTAINSG